MTIEKISFITKVHSGERVEITVTSTAKFIVPVTIDAGKTRLILRFSNGLLIDNRERYGFSDFDARGARFWGACSSGGTPQRN